MATLADLETFFLQLSSSHKLDRDRAFSNFEKLMDNSEPEPYESACNYFEKQARQVGYLESSVDRVRELAPSALDDSWLQIHGVLSGLKVG